MHHGGLNLLFGPSPRCFSQVRNASNHMNSTPAILNTDSYAERSLTLSTHLIPCSCAAANISRIPYYLGVSTYSRGDTFGRGSSTQSLQNLMLIGRPNNNRCYWLQSKQKQESLDQILSGLHRAKSEKGGKLCVCLARSEIPLSFLYYFYLCVGSDLCDLQLRESQENFLCRRPRYLNPWGYMGEMKDMFQIRT